MLNTTDSQEKKMARAVALKAIEQTAGDLAASGGSPLDIQTFVAGARRELAREAGDRQKMGLAAKAAYDYHQST